MQKRFLFFWIGLAALLGTRFTFAFSHAPSLPENTPIKFVGTLTNIPSTTGLYQRFSLPVTGTDVTITTGKFPHYQYNDQLEVEGIVKKQIRSGRELYTMAFPKIAVKHSNNPFSFFGSTIRTYVAKLFHGYLPDIPASLMLGIVFGIKEDIPKSFSSALQVTGVYHIIAASGLNVTFVAAALVSVFGLFLKRQYSLIAALLGIFLYVCIAGFQASIVRAALMAGIAFSAQILGRQQAGIFGLALTAWLMLIINPGFITDVGFQLSFLSTIGILVLKPLFDGLFEHFKQIKKIKLVTFIKDDLLTTTASQIITLPVLLGAFGKYGLLSILVNGLILWTIPLLMVLGSLAVLLSFIPFLSAILLLLSLPVLVYVVWVITYFGHLGFVLTVPQLPDVFWVGYYLLLIACIYPFTVHEKTVPH